MQRPICASLAMSKSTLLIVCFPSLVFHILFILFVSPRLQSSLTDKLIYIPMLCIASLRCFLTVKKIKAWVFYLIPQEQGGGGGGLK